MAGRTTLGDRDVDAILAVADPGDRNRAITEAYHSLALGMRGVVGDRDATWCAFAVWASRTAGVEIRMEEVPALVRAHLAGSPDYHRARSALGRWLEHGEVLRLVDEASLVVRSAVAAGNGTVFAELAPVFVALVEGREVPADGVAPAVAQAGTLYAAARVEPDARRRAQLVLHANLVAVLHEQERLQGSIAAAMDAAPAAAVRDLARRRILGDAAHHLHGPLEAVGRVVERAWEQALTRSLMTLVTSAEVLHLGQDVPPLPGHPLFPAELTPPLLPGLARFCEEHDGTGLTGRGSGASDWRDLRQRMTYILNLFRSRQRHPALFDPPFATAPGPHGRPAPHPA